MRNFWTAVAISQNSAMLQAVNITYICGLINEFIIILTTVNADSKLQLSVGSVPNLESRDAA